MPELNTYVCHKRVRAAKIIKIELVDGLNAQLHFEEPAGSHINVSTEWFFKHSPKVDGYYVVYNDGYASFSPKEAFEGGYTLKAE